MTASASDHSLVCAKSAGGRPSTSQITRTGSCCAKPAISSNSPCCGSAPSSSSVSAVMRSRKRRDHRRLEGAVDQPAQPRVLRRVVEEHPVLGRALERRIGDERAVLPVDRRAPRLAAEARAAQAGAGVGVVADEPDADDVALDPAALAHRAQQRMRVVAERRMAHVDRGGRGGGGVGHRQIRSTQAEKRDQARDVPTSPSGGYPVPRAARARRGRTSVQCVPLTIERRTLR